jgi:hypothetical protein
MASGIPKFYKDEIGDALVAETWKLALFTSSMGTPDYNTMELYSGLTNEVSDSGTGYTTGGATVASKTSAYVDTVNVALDAADVAWSAATFTARYGVLYNATNSKIRMIFDFGGDKTVTGGTFTVAWNTSGIVKIS